VIRMRARSRATTGCSSRICARWRSTSSRRSASTARPACASGCSRAARRRCSSTRSLRRCSASSTTTITTSCGRCSRRAIDRHPIAFLRESRRLADAFDREVVNYVDARNVKAVKWFRWLGFAVSEPVPYGPAGVLFHRFTNARDASTRRGGINGLDSTHRRRHRHRRQDRAGQAGRRHRGDESTSRNAQANDALLRGTKEETRYRRQIAQVAGQQKADFGARNVAVSGTRSTCSATPRRSVKRTRSRSATTRRARPGAIATRRMRRAAGARTS
jgi:hypothetical protein